METHTHYDDPAFRAHLHHERGGSSTEDAVYSDVTNCVRVCAACNKKALPGEKLRFCGRGLPDIPRRIIGSLSARAARVYTARR